ncbi:unnamed protein product [Polarella glacialis]|uniref:RNA-editing substrate-binding complex 6 protein domain-containing protein n=1 Tax=Polarella glacialis TaxID=89957 RepID=A0A813LYK2_POLGL|nr:unnamed protein product [Polarella glacialis]
MPQELLWAHIAHPDHVRLGLPCSATSGTARTPSGRHRGIRVGAFASRPSGCPSSTSGRSSGFAIAGATASGAVASHCSRRPKENDSLEKKKVFRNADEVLDYVSKRTSSGNLDADAAVSCLCHISRFSPGLTEKQLKSSELLAIIEKSGQSASSLSGSSLVALLQAVAKLQRVHHPSLSKLLDLCTAALSRSISRLEPQHLALAAWALAKTEQRDILLMQHLAQRAETVMWKFGALDLCMLAWALATLRARDRRLFQSIGKQARTKLVSFSPQGLSNLAWAFAKIREDSWTSDSETLDDDSGLLRELALTASGKLLQFKAQELANLCWALAKTKTDQPDLFRGVAQEVRRRLTTFSPQHVSNIAWAFASVGFSNFAPLFQDLSGVATARLEEFKPQELSSLTWAFAKLKVEDLGLVSSAAKAALRHPSSFGARELASLCWACATLGVREEAFLRVAVARAVSCDFSPQDLAGVLWAVARLGIQPPIEDLRELARKVVDGQLQGFCPQDLSNLAWAFARFGLPDTELFHALGSAAATQTPQLRSQEISNLAWAFATVLLQHEDLFAAVTTVQLQDFRPQELSSVCWAFATLRLRGDENDENDAFLASLAAASLAKSEELSPQSLSNLAWSFAKLSREIRPELLDVFVGALATRTAEFEPQGLQNGAWALAALGLEEPGAWQLVFEAVSFISPSLSIGISGDCRPQLRSLAKEAQMKAFATMEEKDEDGIMTKVAEDMPEICVLSELFRALASELRRKLTDFSARLSAAPSDDVRHGQDLASDILGEKPPTRCRQAASSNAPVSSIATPGLEHVDEEAAEQVQCPMCHDVFMDPVLVCDAEHHLCRSCANSLVMLPAQRDRKCPRGEELLELPRRVLQRSEMKLPRCPSCRQKVHIRDGQRFLRNMVAQLRVRCPNKARGCAETPTREQVESHVRACPYSVVKCEFCSLTTERQLLSHTHHHCDAARFGCDFVSDNDSAVTMHLVDCPVSKCQRQFERYEEQIAKLQREVIPPGGILPWSGKRLPEGWALCDGQNGWPDLSQQFRSASLDEGSARKRRRGPDKRGISESGHYSFAYIVRVREEHLFLPLPGPGQAEAEVDDGEEGEESGSDEEGESGESEEGSE